VAVEFARIDDRLLHGQVITTWVHDLRLEQCIVVSGAVEKDEFQRRLLEMAAPEGMRVVFFSPEKLARIAQANPIRRRTMLLFNDPRDVLTLLENGFKLENLNIGGMKNDGRKRQIAKAVAVSGEDEALLRKIADAGVRLSIRMVPAEDEISFERAAKRSAVPQDPGKA
jgi:PTS system mannose-specific IIB component